MNVEQIVQDGVSGIATYTAELVRRLPPLGWDVTPFTARHGRAHVDAAMRAAGLVEVDPVVLPLPRPALYDAWHTLGVAGPSRRIAPVDLVHAPSVAVPPVTGVPLVVTAHDAAPVTWPQTYTRRGRWFHARGFRAAARRARLVIAVSEFSAGELAAHTPIPRERIRVVPNGVRLEQPSEDDVRRARARHGVGDRPYVLWVGTMQPRKNVPVLVEAFGRAATDGLPHALVLVGAQGWLGAGAAAGAGDSVIVAGPIAGPELAALYAGADLFAFPSLHEGVGLPVLESVAQGPAVLASDIPALREVAGDAARFVAPDDVAGWHGALGDLLGDASARDALCALGAARAAQYSWERCAQRTAAVYAEALAASG
jgi:glycosyltransferase involved in cell wall biosynthesis